jgi:hypothetical protein
MGSDSRGLSRIDLPAGGAHMLNQTAGKTLGGCSGGPPLRWGLGAFLRRDRDARRDQALGRLLPTPASSTMS